MILDALEKARWNKSTAAKELGISRSNLITKVKQYGLER
jgi:transcriptional regulator of acetoin/glycerol metabolism